MPTMMFDVVPEELEASASRIENKAGEFKNAYNSIYTAVSDLHVKYKGEASETFFKRIESYKKDFASADKALQNYVKFLRDYAAKMKATENEIKAKASALSAG